MGRGGESDPRCPETKSSESGVTWARNASNGTIPGRWFAVSGRRAFTLDRYAHVLPGMQKKAAAKLEAILFGE